MKREKLVPESQPSAILTAAFIGILVMQYQTVKTEAVIP